MNEDKDEQNKSDMPIIPENTEQNTEQNTERNLENQSDNDRENPFKNPKFYIGYFCGLIPLAWGVISDDGAYWDLFVMIVSIPYFGISFFIWLVLKRKNRALALGILLAGITPLIMIFLLTGGCGLLSF